MVVLSAAIVTTSKTLIARQFVEMTRIRIEGLLSAFPKLLDSGRDHTFIETETVRYVYQPMEALFLVLVTNKSSNILEDLETLRLLAKVVQDCCQIQVNEEQVLKEAFNIIFAFDEVISFGHRESVTLSQIKTYTEMDSHEEKLHQMIEQSKINEAKEMAKRKQMELAKLRLNQPKDGSGSGMPGMGGGGPGSGSSMEGIGSSSFQDSMGSGSGGGGGGGGSGMGGMGGGGSGGGGMGGMSMDSGSSAPPPWASMADDGPATVIAKTAKKGMALGKKKPGDIFGGLGPAEASPAAAVEEQVEAPAAPAVNPLADPVIVAIEEKISAELQVEGGLEGDITCNGEFRVTVLDTAKADLVSFKVSPQDSAFKYKTHPNLNKASHANNILEVRDASKAFKANNPVPLVKWQGKSSDEAALPVTLSCWPSAEAGGTQIVLELELTDTSLVLEDIYVRFQCPGSAKPNVTDATPGEAAYDASTGEVRWFIPRMDKSETTGNLEFTAACDSASLLPYGFEATRRNATKCPMDILECYHMDKKEPITYMCEKTSTYQFRCGV